MQYAFQFYRIHMFFNKYADLRDFINEQFEMVGWDGQPYKMPQDRQDFFR